MLKKASKLKNILPESELSPSLSMGSRELSKENEL